MNKDEKTIKDSVETLNYLLTQLIVELKQLNSTLQDLTFLTANKKMIQKEQKREDDKGFAGDKAALERYLKEKCPTTWKNMDEIKEFKSGDFLITFDYVSSDEYKRMAEEIKEHLNGYYSKKYRGFIVPRSKAGGKRPRGLEGVKG